MVISNKFQASGDTNGINRKAFLEISTNSEILLMILQRLFKGSLRVYGQ